MHIPALKKTLFMLVFVLFLLLLLIIKEKRGIFLESPVFQTDSVNTHTSNSHKQTAESISGGECDDVLNHMTRGHWKTRPLTKKENDDIIEFLTNAQARFRFPTNYQRTDGLCGNVTHKSSQWFRALCDPRGATPCCYHNQCAMKSVEECVCEDCYDMRHMKHAEYSTWIPSNSACPYKEHTPQEACDILNGTTIVFVGDSLVRHVYTALLLVVTGNMKDGAIGKNNDKDERASCQGMYMFTEKVCRLLLNMKFQGCRGSVHLKLLYYHHVGYGSDLRDAVMKMKERTVIFTGIGSHNSFKHERVINEFLSPALTYLKTKQQKWPKFIWAASHAPGMLKSPIVLSQTYGSVKKFNDKMKPFLKSWKIPIFDTFNLTDGMMSFDGEHYGRGMNIVKANILLSYIREMRSKEKW